jgi:hypothetical protein
MYKFSKKTLCFEEQAGAYKSFLVTNEEDAILIWIHDSSVADPDPYVFGPPGSASGSVSHKYGSGSGDPSIIKQK